MPREKPYYRDVLADVVEVTGKRMLGVYDIMKYLGIGYNKATAYLNGGKEITAHIFAGELLERRK